MTPLSPMDALGPAFRRTREVLAEPFRLGFFLKLALVAALTQPGFYSVSISYPIQGVQFATLKQLGHRSGFGDNFQMVPAGIAAAGFIAILVVLAIAFAIWIVAAYLYCRLRFTLFDLVVYKRGRVRQAWSLYKRQAWRYFGLIILVTLGFMVIATIIIGPTLLNVIRVVRPLAAAGAGTNPFPMLGAMVPFLCAFLLVAALWAVVDALMQDFLLPPMAIEDAPIESAFKRLFRLLKTDFGPVAIYILLRFAVVIALTWILMLALILVLATGGLVLFAAGTALYHLLWANILGRVICVALAIIAGLIVLTVYALAVISIYGISAVFKQSYAAQFFGGRYPQLGAILQPDLGHPISRFSEHQPFPPSLPEVGDPPPVW